MCQLVFLVLYKKMSTLCDICRAFPWRQLDRERKFRYAWWKKESLQVPLDDRENLTPLSESEIILSPAVTDRSEDVKTEKFIYYKKIKKIKASAAEGCHICRLVWRGFIDYSIDDFGSRQKEDMLAYFERNSSQIHIAHKPASGDLEFCFGSEAFRRTVTLRYYFVSRKYVSFFSNPRLKKT